MTKTKVKRGAPMAVTELYPAPRSNPAVAPRIPVTTPNAAEMPNVSFLGKGEDKRMS